MWKFYALLSALFASLTAIFAKVGLKNIHPDLATAVRTLIILVFTLPVVVWGSKQKELLSFSSRNWIFLILSGLSTGLSWLFYYRALQNGDTSIVSAIDKSSLLFVILFAFLFLNEPLNLKTIVGSLLILSGLLVVIWK